MSDLRTSRRNLAAEIDLLEAERVSIQERMKEAYGAYAEAHGKAEKKATQAAIKRRQKYAAGKREEMEEHDELADEAFVDISGTVHAITRAPHEEAA